MKDEAVSLLNGKRAAVEQAKRDARNAQRRKRYAERKAEAAEASVEEAQARVTRARSPRGRAAATEALREAKRALREARRTVRAKAREAASVSAAAIRRTGRASAGTRGRIAELEAKLAEMEANAAKAAADLAEARRIAAQEKIDTTREVAKDILFEFKRARAELDAEIEEAGTWVIARYWRRADGSPAKNMSRLRGHEDEAKILAALRSDGKAESDEANNKLEILRPDEFHKVAKRIADRYNVDVSEVYTLHYSR